MRYMALDSKMERKRYIQFSPDYDNQSTMEVKTKRLEAHGQAAMQSAAWRSK